MYLHIKFLILIFFCASMAMANVVQTKPNDAIPKDKENDKRDKRQLTFIPNDSSVYADAVQQQQQQQQQQTGILGLGQNIPIIGTLVSGLPVVGSGQNLWSVLPGNLGTTLGGLTSGLQGTLGGLGGGLGNLGQLGNLGGLLGGTAPTATNSASCPVSQKLSCRCEPLVPLKTLGTRADNQHGIIEILDQSIKGNVDGSSEVIANLSNGVTMYQKMNNPMMMKDIDGYFTLKIASDRYLTIYYTINDADYTVKADVNSAPPKPQMEIDNGHENLIGNL